MNTLELIQLIGYAILTLAILIYVIVMAIRGKWIGKLTATLEKAVKEAEASGKTGEEKKAYVLEQFKLKCEELGIPYRLISSYASKMIDIIIKNYNIIAK